MNRKLSATDHMKDVDHRYDDSTMEKSGYILPCMKDALTKEEIEQFVQSGYVKIENAFSEDLAEAGRSILWKDTGCDPDDPLTWIHPVIRLGDYPQEPFRLAANSPMLHTAADQLVGKGRWFPRALGLSLSAFPVHKIQVMQAGMLTPASMEAMDR